MDMGLLDSVLSAVEGGNGQGGQGGQAALLQAVVAQVNNYPGGLPALVEKLRQGGLAEVVESWVGTGSNQPVSGEQLQSALGDDTIDNIAQSAGQDRSTVLAGLGQLLPHVVDHATPDGNVNSGGLDASALLGSLSGLLGRL
jgi:uncharacterized protein YidB (DUF937 family)